MLPHHEVDFAHPSEREFAALLDFWRVRWWYEPTTFVLDEHADGTPRAAFTPDFWLPDFDLYLELTTLQQRLVTKKHRKLRRLAERYPHVRCKILYRRDIQALAEQFGLDESRVMLAG